MTSYYKVTDTELSSIADAIRQKGSTSAPLVFPSGFVSAVIDIPTGGGGSAVLGSLSVSENGTYTPTGGLDGFDNVVVDVQGGVTPSGSISISQNGTYDVSSFANAVVSVPQSGGDAELLNNIFFGISSGPIYNSGASEIRSYMFSGTQVTEVNAPAVKLVWNRAFAGCSLLSKVDLASCESVDTYAFTHCTLLSSVLFPELKSINSYGFYMAGLGYIDFPKLQSIGSNAFARCENLSFASMSAIKTMSTYAFTSCSSLRTVMLGSNIQSIGTSAFLGCISLESLYVFANSAFNINQYVLSTTPIEKSSYLGYFGSIYVLESMVDAFKSASGWSYFSDRITAYVE